MPYYRLFYHFIWTTKQRLPLIVEANEAAIYHAIHNKVQELNGIVHAANGTEDHVHLLVTIPPVLAPAKFIGQIKGISSYVASDIGGGAGTFGWQNEYGLLSVSESHLSVIVRYIELQKQHHAENTVDPRLEMPMSGMQQPGG